MSKKKSHHRAQKPRVPWSDPNGRADAAPVDTTPTLRADVQLFFMSEVDQDLRSAPAEPAKLATSVRDLSELLAAQARRPIVFYRLVLARDEHARIRGSDLLDPVQDRTDGKARADDLVAALDLVAQPSVLLLEAALLEGVADGEQDAVGVERLLEDVVRA